MKLRGPNGEVVDVDASEAARLIQTVGGWSEVGASDEPLTEVQRLAREETGAAGVAGLASGLTLGLSDQGPLPFGIGPQLTEARKAVRDENPIASGVGNIVGTVVGPGKFFKAGNTLKSAIALGAAEGSMLGLGAAISEDGLGDKEALSEKLLANVGFGAVVGGGSGAVARGLTRGAEAISKKLGNYTLNADVQGLKDRLNRPSYASQHQLHSDSRPASNSSSGKSLQHH